VDKLNGLVPAAKARRIEKEKKWHRQKSAPSHMYDQFWHDYIAQEMETEGEKVEGYHENEKSHRYFILILTPFHCGSCCDLRLCVL
jgi:hypothetical protein